MLPFSNVSMLIHLCTGLNGRSTLTDDTLSGEIVNVKWIERIRGSRLHVEVIHG